MNTYIQSETSHSCTVTIVPTSVDILLDWTRSTEILSWKKNFERVESSNFQKWHSLDSLEFSLFCFERVSSTRRVFLKGRLFYASTENVLPLFYKKEKLLAKEKDLAKQKLSSKPAKTTETVEAVVPKSLTKNRQNIERASLPNDKSQREPFNKDLVSKRTWKDQSFSSI